jgi:hypothetical protein
VRFPYAGIGELEHTVHERGLLVLEDPKGRALFEQILHVLL